MITHHVHKRFSSYLLKLMINTNYLVIRMPTTLEVASSPIVVIPAETNDFNGMGWYCWAEFYC